MILDLLTPEVVSKYSSSPFIVDNVFLHRSYIIRTQFSVGVSAGSIQLNKEWNNHFLTHKSYVAVRSTNRTNVSLLSREDKWWMDFRVKIASKHPKYCRKPNWFGNNCLLYQGRIRSSIIAMESFRIELPMLKPLQFAPSFLLPLFLYSAVLLVLRHNVGIIIAYHTSAKSYSSMAIKLGVSEQTFKNSGGSSGDDFQFFSFFIVLDIHQLLGGV